MPENIENLPCMPLTRDMVSMIRRKLTMCFLRSLLKLMSTREKDHFYQLIHACEKKRNENDMLIVKLARDHVNTWLQAYKLPPYDSDLYDDPMFIEVVHNMALFNHIDPYVYEIDRDPEWFYNVNRAVALLQQL